MLARPTCTATNSPHEPPVKASPVRSSTCAHRLMVERASQSLVRLIMLTYQAGTGEPFPNIKPVAQLVRKGGTNCSLIDEHQDARTNSGQYLHRAGSYRRENRLERTSAK